MDSSIIFKLFIVSIIFLTIVLVIGGMGDLKKVRRIGVTGSGFIVLASTLTAIHKLPLEVLAFLLGVDKFMSEAKAITNFIGNGVACIVIYKSEGEFITVENPIDIERE